ncbi:MAG: hypothetical protein LBN36_08950 [Clostridiales Family XIII bacterium]|jgi:hypothetical protein|nr:hypothetical protein [Clostridiales Family XIII bacterium]
MIFTNGQNKQNLIRNGTWILVFAVMIAAFAFSPLTAFADDAAKITVGSQSQEQEAGSEFTVPVNLENNPGFAGATFAVSYDAEALELLEIDGKDGILSSSLLVNLPEHSAGYLSFSKNNTENGLLFNLTFKVKDSAKTGNYDIVVNLKDNLEKNFVSIEAKVVPATFTSGTVSVKAAAEPPITTTPGGQNVTDSIDVNASGSSQATVGTPIFISAKEGSLNWNAAQFDGYYDAEKGGYVLTPKTTGKAELKYTDEAGNEKSLEVEIGDAQTPLIASNSTHPGWLIPLIICAAVVIAALIVFFIIRRRKAGLATEKDGTEQ